MIKVTPIQLEVLRAMDPQSSSWDPTRRPRGSLERLAKKGLVEGDRRVGWKLTDKGRNYLLGGKRDASSVG